MLFIYLLVRTFVLLREVSCSPGWSPQTPPWSYVVQDNSEIHILLPLPPQCYNKCLPPIPRHAFLANHPGIRAWEANILPSKLYSQPSYYFIYTVLCKDRIVLFSLKIKSSVEEPDPHLLFLH